MPTLTPGYNLGLSQTQLKQTLGNQGGQPIAAYLPDPSKFTGIPGTEYAQGTAPNLRYVADTIYKQYRDASGNTFELVPSSNPAGLSDPGTFLRQISGAPQGYAQTPQELLSSFKNFTPLGTGSIFENVAKNEPLNIQPGETAEQYYKRTGIGYSPAFGQPLPAPITTSPQQVSNPLSNTNIAPASNSVPNASINPPQYTGNSIVDYLNSIGKPSDFSSRRILAQQAGISTYTGTAQQNTQLLNQLRGQQTPVAQNISNASTASTVPTASITSTPPTASTGAVVPTPEQSFQDQFQNILKNYGITPNSPTQSPLTSYADYYKQFLNQIGYPDIKAQFDATQKKYTDLKNELQDKIAAVNDNPFISEGLRSAKITKLQTLYEAKTGVLNDQLKIYESQLNRADENARFVAGQALQFTHQNAQLNEQAVSKAIEIATKELEFRQAQAERALNRESRFITPDIREYNLAQSQGYNGTFLEYQKQIKNLKIPSVNINGTGIFGGPGATGIDSLAQALLDGRTVPSQLPGFGQNSLKAQALRRAFELDPTYNPAQAESEYSFGKNASTQNRIRRIDNVARTIDEAITISNNIQRSNIKPLNRGYLAFLGNVGSKDAARLTSINTLLGDELGQIFSGSQASDFKTRLGLALTDPAASQQQYIAALREIQKNMGFVRDSLSRGTFLQNQLFGAINVPGVSGTTKSGLKYTITK